ncbi:MAG: asparagine synthase (glutamine-hydrolyzing) [Candidatus Cloacimonetes bacterium]|nr:asparagine synthase (glutamine-hydrolyzing) [Candidatus Cloacimonadota bacterium]
MCGIFGVIGRDPNFCMQKMLNRLEHRGPDDQNIYSNGDISFGHTRLSIIGHNDGAQPLVDESLNALIFNGEIYNFKELGRKYFQREFTSDTQLLFELLKKLGSKCLKELRGMFSFVFYNTKDRSTLLVRDPFGMKPLYYSQQNSCIYFCSEFLPLQQSLRTTLCESSFYDYLQLGTSIAHETLDQKVQQLLPGQFLLVVKNQIQKDFYYSLDELLIEGNSHDFEKVFESTCLRHTISDVDLGLMLSGGMDSTSIAISLKNAGVENLDCYSLGFNDPEFDESDQAKRVAEFLGYRHTRIEFPQTKIIDFLQEALDALDGPFGDASFIPTYFLCKEISKEKKVVLSGDGGDEVFFGYPTFMANKVQSFLPQWVQKIVAKVFHDLKVDTNTRVTFKEKLQRFAWGMTKGSPDRFLAYMSSISPEVFQERFTISSQKLSKQESNCSAIFVYYFKQYLGSQLLVKTDRASMKNSLEVRCPFLDIDFIQEVFELPNLGFPVFQNAKAPIRKYLSKKLPKRLHSFEKKGFSAPLYQILPSLKAIVERKHGLNLNCTKDKLFRYRFFSYNLLVYMYFYPSDSAQKVFKRFIGL